MPAVVQSRAITCPGCGGAIQLRGFAHTLTATCGSCGALLDTSKGEVALLSRAQSRQKVEPLIPMGARGAFDGVTYEAIGFEQRYMISYGQTWFWQEYVLFHPYKGFRYLLEHEGHWNFIRPAEVLPSGAVNRTYDGKTFRLFERAAAHTGYVVGEFPWRVQVGDVVMEIDYIAPPYVLTSESTSDETTWSIGRYATPQEVWSAFKLTTPPAKPKGVYADQPNPYGDKPGHHLKLFALFVLIGLALLVIFSLTHSSTPVFHDRFTFDPSAKTDQTIVSPEFELKGSVPAAVRVETVTNVSQNWLYVNYTLINQDTNQSYDFGETLSYYSGVDGGESWSEGSPRNGTTVHSVKPGRYVLRIEPEREVEAGESPRAALRPISYEVIVHHGVTNYGIFFIMILLLLPPPIFTWWRYRVFENRRWIESDVSGSSAIGGSSDE